MAFQFTQTGQELQYLFNEVEQLAGDYDGTQTYAVGDYCNYLGVVYRCTASTTGTFDAADWTSIIVLDELEALTSALNTSKSNLLTTREYTYSPSTNISAGDIDTYYIDVTLSGYTFLGVVGARVTGTSNCPLLIADYASATQAFVRVRNSSSSATYPNQVVVRALYVKNS